MGLRVAWPRGRRFAHGFLERHHILVAHVFAHDAREVSIRARMRESARAIGIHSSRIGADLHPRLREVEFHAEEIRSGMRGHQSAPMTTELRENGTGAAS